MSRLQETRSNELGAPQVPITPRLPVTRATKTQQQTHMRKLHLSLIHVGQEVDSQHDSELQPELETRGKGPTGRKHEYEKHSSPQDEPGPRRKIPKGQKDEGTPRVKPTAHMRKSRSRSKSPRSARNSPQARDIERLNPSPRAGAQTGMAATAGHLESMANLAGITAIKALEKTKTARQAAENLPDVVKAAEKAETNRMCFKLPKCSKCCI